jgi:glycosyltransferase involved in cell wall biosynthesis
MIAVTPLVLTYNERENIGRVLAALTWAPEVVLVDSFSDDGTLALAHATHPGVRVVQRAFDSFAGQCNFGLTLVRTPWVLSLDADYILTPELGAEITTLDPPEGVAGYRAAFRYCVWGRPLRATLYPPRDVLYRRELARYEDEGHGHRVRVAGTVRALTGHIDHDDRKPFSRWLRSQDSYMVIESRHLLNADAGTLSRQDRLRRRVYYAPAVMFVYLLLVRRLAFDGWQGWFYVFQRTLAEIMLALRLLVEREKMEPLAKACCEMAP